MLITLCALAFILGFAVRRGQTCAVLAVLEVIEARKYERFWSFITCAAWAAVFAMPLVWLTAPQTALAPHIDLGFTSLIGGLFFGLGAAVNGACAFGTLSRIVSGNSGFLFVIPGMAIGVFGLQSLSFDWVPKMAPNSFNFPGPMAYAAWGFALLIVLREGVAIVKGWISFRAFFRRLIWRFWTPRVAMAVVGAAGGVLYVFGPDWSYGDAIEQIVMTALVGRPVHVDPMLGVLVIAALIGGVFAATIQHEFKPVWPQWEQIGASLSGGALMGFGGAMIPGGNDGIILYAMPGFALYGFVGYIAMNLAIALALFTRIKLYHPRQSAP